MKDLFKMKKIRNLGTCGKSVVAGITARFFSMVLMILTLCVGNAWGATYYWNIKVVPVYIDAEGNTTHTGDARFAHDGSTTSTSSTNWQSGKTEYVFDTYTTTSSSGKSYLHVSSIPSGYYFWGFYSTSGTSTASTRGGFDENKEEKYREYYGSSSKYDKQDCQVYLSGNNGSKPDQTTIHAVFRTYPYYRYNHKLTLKNDAYSGSYVNMVILSGTTTPQLAETNIDVSATNIFITKNTNNGGEYTTDYPNLSGTASKSTTFSSNLRPKSNQSPYVFHDTIRAFAQHGHVIDLTTTQSSLPAGVEIVDLTNVRKGLYCLDVSVTGTAASEVSSTPTCTLKTKDVSATPITMTIKKDAVGGSVTGQFSYYSFTSTTLKHAEHGDAISLEAGDTEWSGNTIPGENGHIYEGDILTLTATPSEGYVFYRWYTEDANGIKQTLLYGDPNLSITVPAGGQKIGAEFTAALYSVSGIFMEDLPSAIQAAQSEIANGAASSTILVMQENVRVPAGSYTIPANVTLLIPYRAGQVEPSASLERVNTDDVPTGAYSTLTLEDGAHFEVYGTIEVSGTQTTGGFSACADKGIGRTGAPTYGLMDMKKGSSITLNKGAEMKAWGYVIGDRDANGRYTCEIDVRRGATVYEQFQIMDWKQVMDIVKITNYENSKKVLPINQYHIQNIEVAALYRPGSRLYGVSSINLWGTVFAMDNAGVLGIRYNDPNKDDDKAIFLLDNADESEDTWIRKFYDPDTDQQVYEANNSAYLGSLQMYVYFPGISVFTGMADDNINVDSRGYQLPITNNFKLHLLSGRMQITQNTELLPGSVLEVDKESTLEINENAILLLYDADNWGNYVTTGFDDPNYTFGCATRIKHRHGTMPTNENRNISSAATLGDAKLIVHGTVDVKGMFKTTDGGATIISTIEDAGTVTISREAGTGSNVPGDNTYQVSGIVKNTSVSFTTIHRIPALLQNGAGCTYGPTTNTADTLGGRSFCFIDKNKDGIGEWVVMVDDGCFVKETVGNVTTYYAKPQEYVALANGKTANADHTYSDAAGAGRLFILMDDCQWWEVENVDNLYHCIHPDNDTYYFYDNNRYVQEGNSLVHSPAWVEKKFAISWKNWDGSALRDGDNELRPYELTYGTQPKFLHTNPTRPDDVDYTYNFIGWTPTPVPVTGDATYTALYEKIQKKYTIIFQDQSGNEISRQQLALGESPTPPDVSSIANSYWNPSIAVVSGNATYQVAVYDEAPTEFTVTWANYDGSTIYTEQVANGDAPVYDPTHEVENVAVGKPTKNLNNEYNYTWTGWQSAAGTYSTEAALPEMNANITYIATFSSAEKTYAIRFYQENGTTQIGETQNLVFGATPVVPEYNKPSTAEYTYVTEWVDMEAAPLLVVPVRTVTGDADYKANFVETKNRYTLKLQSNNNDVCAFTGAGVYDYGTANIAVAASIASGYEFVRWEGVDWTTASGTIEELIGDMTLTLYVQPTAGVSNLEVAANHTTSISEATQCNDFVLTSNGTQSGQVTGAEKIELFGDAYYDLVLDGPQDRTWYSVAVPWQVDATSGIWAKNGTSARRLVLGSDFDIIYYNGARRAAGESQAWDYLEDQSSKIMMPGKAYMIAFRSAPQTIRFQKVSRAAILNTQTSVEMYPSTETSKANWNGIANPALYYAYINAGSENGIGYIYRAGRPDSQENRYVSFEMDEAKLIVGQPIYVQAGEAKSIVANTSAYSNAAPRRDKMAAKETRYKVDIMREGKQNDRIYLQTDDEKEDMYIIGQDLAKMGVSSKVAQMWIDRYNSKLCLNTIASVDEVATYPLGISAPQAGEYTIELISQPNDDSDLYLTLDGQAIWNLSDGAYTAYLEKGTTNRYGLRISVKKTPTVATGMDEAVVNAKGETKKVLVNGQVFVIRGEKVYSIDGRMVK